ncbi:DUF4190 domain-containing protein [Microbacterium luteum]|uniref:DUF4190 domain-containing protein n=1 Tax=Microbacterium luteum TaxID=2782167 RepID=UPI00188976BE|nr:DUF4190 domain-containing protein [Microbacterium luteum]
MTQPDPHGGPTSPGACPPPAHGATPPPYGAGGPAGARTNTLAIVSLIASISAFVILPFLGSLAGVITGHMSLSQISRTGEQGRGLALAGLIVGYVGLALAVIGVIAVILFFGVFLTAVSQSTYS